VDILIKEYAIKGELLPIVFEGTSDEYKELCSICEEEDYKNKVLLSKSDCYLENARDILPEINEIPELFIAYESGK
jgi:hypothetical protein